MVDNTPIKKSSQFEVVGAINKIIPKVINWKKKKEIIKEEPAPETPQIGLKPVLDEEKVEVLIKESIMINPRDFSAFKHALEDFVKSWNK